MGITGCGSLRVTRQDSTMNGPRRSCHGTQWPILDLLASGSYLSTKGDLSRINYDLGLHLQCCTRPSSTQCYGFIAFCTPAPGHRAQVRVHPVDCEASIGDMVSFVQFLQFVSTSLPFGSRKARCEDQIWSCRTHVVHAALGKAGVP